MGSEYQGQGWNRMSTRMFDDIHQQQLQQHHDFHNQIHNNMMNDLHNDPFMSSTNSPPSSNGFSIKIGNYTFRISSLAGFFGIYFLLWIFGFEVPLLSFIVYYFIIFPMVIVGLVLLFFGIVWFAIFRSSKQ